MRFLYCLLIFYSSICFAATQGTLYLVGTIPLHFDIRIDPVIGQLNTLNLEDGEASLKVADVVEASNNTAGYEIYIESVNGGELTHNNGTSNVPYQIQYGVAGSLNSPPAVGSPLLVKTSGALAGLTFDFEAVSITIAPTSGLPGGAYTDTLVISMQAL